MLVHGISHNFSQQAMQPIKLSILLRSVNWYSGENLEVQP